LNVIQYFKFDLFFGHPGFENQINKLLELQVFRWNVGIPALSAEMAPLGIGSLVEMAFVFE